MFSSIRLGTLCSLLSASSFCLLAAQSSISEVRWNELRIVALLVKSNLENGAARPAHMRLIQMEMILAGSSQASKTGDQIASIESTAIPSDRNPAVSALLPMVDSLLQAIGSSDSGSAYSYLQQLSNKLEAMRVQRARQVLSSSDESARGDAMFNVRTNLQLSLGTGKIAESVELATEMKAIIADRLERHAFVEEYALDHYLIYDALGRAAFASENYGLAGQYLQRAAETPPNANGTTMLNDFGPNLWLAEQLLKVGKVDGVLKFLLTCKENFWTRGSEKADPWIAALRNKKPISLSPNSLMGYGYLPE